MKSLEIKYIETKDSNLTIEVNGYLLHSKYNPIRETEKFIEKEFDNETLNVIFGLGKGYIYDILLQKGYLEDKFLIIEPIEEFEKLAQEGSSVIFGFDLIKIDHYISQKLKFYSRKVNVICSPNYDKIFPVEYLELLKKVTELQNINVVLDNTVKKLSETWQENSVHNIYYINKAVSLNALKNAYDCPVVIASGGPSLIKQIPLLKKMRKNVLLIAAGSTINTLVANEIEPDYVISIDGSESNYEKHFKDLNLKNTILLFSALSRYKIQKHYQNLQYAFFDQRDKKMKAYFENIHNIDLPAILGGGSVANFALSIARFISSGPIALIGQDLAYTDGISHAEGNKNKTKTDSEYLSKVGAFEIDGYYGENVWTDYPFFMMKEGFELIMEYIEKPETIFNSTEGGVKIQKINQLSFMEFYEKHIDKTLPVTIKHDQAPSINTGEIKDRLRKEVNIYINIALELKKAIKALDNNISTTEFSQQTLKVLDTVDEKVDNLMKKVIMEQINDPITVDVMTQYEDPGNETREEMYDRVYRQNVELYNRLLEATEKTIAYTRDIINEI